MYLLINIQIMKMSMRTITLRLMKSFKKYLILIIYL